MKSRRIPARAPTADELWLYQAAEAARERAYAPYSQFKVGAALVTVVMGPISERPRPVTAANVENASYGLTICAERSAVVRAIAEGFCPEAITHALAAASGVAQNTPPASIAAIAIAGEKAKTVSPCGACRQVLQQFAAPGLVVTFMLDRRIQTFDFAALVPVPFEL